MLFSNGWWRLERSGEFMSDFEIEVEVINEVKLNLGLNVEIESNNFDYCCFLDVCSSVEGV